LWVIFHLFLLFGFYLYRVDISLLAVQQFDHPHGV
jgi:hypothetical protein